MSYLKLRLDAIQKVLCQRHSRVLLAGIQRPICNEVPIVRLDARYASQARFAGHTCTHCVQCGVTVVRFRFRKTFAIALSLYASEADHDVCFFSLSTSI